LDQKDSCTFTKVLTHVCEVLDEIILVWCIHDLIQLYISFKFSADSWSDFKVLSVSLFSSASSSLSYWVLFDEAEIAERTG
jgi:hypothetical protein